MNYPYKMDENNIQFWKEQEREQLRKDVWRAYNDLMAVGERVKKLSIDDNLPEHLAVPIAELADSVWWRGPELSGLLPGAIEAELEPHRSVNEQQH